MTSGGGQPTVELDGVGKVFRPPPAPWRHLLRLPPQPDVVALHEVDLRIEPGEVLGLVGPNGAGKTVLVKLIATLTEPTVGSVRVLGRDTRRDSRAIRGLVGLSTPDERSFYWRLTGRQNLRFFARLYGDAAAGERRIGELGELLDLGAALDRPYRTLSAGNRQRLAIARALLPDPPLLLLDEPTSHLDPIAAARLRGVVADRIAGDRGRAVLFTTHDMVEVQELCSRVAILHQGRLLECAELPRLRARYGATDRTTLTVRRPDPAVLDSLRIDIAGLTIENDQGPVVTLAFTHDADDGRLDAVLAGLVRGGAHILSCHSAGEDLEALFRRVVERRGQP